MLITQDEKTIEIMDGAERDQTFVTDGIMRKETRGPATLTRGAGWQGGALRIVQGGGPLTVIRTLRLDPDGKRLRATLEFRQGEKVHTANLVYDSPR